MGGSSAATRLTPFPGPGRRARNSYLIRTGDLGAPAIAERNLWKRLAAARSYHVEGCLIKAQSQSHTQTEPWRAAAAANMGHIMFGRNKKHMPRFGSAIRVGGISPSFVVLLRFQNSAKRYCAENSIFLNTNVRITLLSAEVWRQTPAKKVHQQYAPFPI